MKLRLENDYNDIKHYCEKNVKGCCVFEACQ